MTLECNFQLQSYQQAYLSYLYFSYACHAFAARSLLLKAALPHYY